MAAKWLDIDGHTRDMRATVMQVDILTQPFGGIKGGDFPSKDLLFLPNTPVVYLFLALRMDQATSPLRSGASHCL